MPEKKMNALIILSNIIIDIITRNDLLDQHCKRERTDGRTACHKEKVKMSRFSYLKISTSKHLIKCYKLTLIF
jgi:hypothetical protein